MNPLFDISKMTEDQLVEKIVDLSKKIDFYAQIGNNDLLNQHLSLKEEVMMIYQEMMAKKQSESINKKASKFKKDIDDPYTIIDTDRGLKKRNEI